MSGVGVEGEQTTLGYLLEQLDLLCWGGGRLGHLMTGRLRCSVHGGFSCPAAE